VGATTTPVYLHPDLLGSPRKASSGTGALLWQEHYDPYGAKLNGSETTVGYTGHAHDATGLTYMKARFYDPSQHRFLTPDPIHFVDDNPFTFNRYAYGNNNPYKFTDSTGELGLLIHAFQKGLPVEGAVTISQAGNTAMAVGGAAIIVSVDTLSGGRGLVKNAVVGVRAVEKVIDAAKGIGKVGPATDKAGNQIGRIVMDSKGNAMIEPVGGRTVAAAKGGVDTHTLYPNGSNYQRLNPQGHANNPTPHGHGHAPGTGPGMKGQGASLDVHGNVVPSNSPAAHWPIN